MNTQKGFSTILIVIIGLLVIGGGVYYLSDMESITKEPRMDDSSIFPEDTNYDTQYVRKDSGDEIPSKMNSLYIKELDIKINLNSDIDDLTYSMKGSFGNQIACLSTRTLLEETKYSPGDCSCGLGYISLYRKGDGLYNPAGFWEGPDDRCSGVKEEYELQYRLKDSLRSALNNSGVISY